ncbi:MAG: transcription termination factor Rho [Planctomycetaceae bacterium]|jgi:transcription termination factor Rho|nr:transcription termination factor Rho [Planctomycetaceae bacterium]
MQKKTYNPNYRNNNNPNRKFRPNGGKPRPAPNSDIPGTPRDISPNPRFRNPNYAVHIEPGDPSTYYEVTGVLEMHPNGYGFLRDPNNHYTRIITDPFVPASTIDRYGLRRGVLLTGMIQPGTKTQGPRLREAVSVDGVAADEYIHVKHFEERIPITPEEWLRLETGAQPLTTRVMDIFTPLGKGQRALIVAPPRSGKTILLHHISQAVVKNHPDVKVIVLLIDERPEEVTDFQRAAIGAEVVASSLDREIESHVRLSQLVIERCRRLAEMGKDVFLLLDSITRLARAFNKHTLNSSNRSALQTGGIDVKAMEIPKQLFASARAFEGGGSLTIVGTALIETNSRMDDAIFQEFKGTGNMELVLDRRLAEQRIWPAIDISQSGTRKEEKLFPPEILQGATMIRRALSSRSPVDAMETLTAKLGKFNSNAEFFYQFLKGSKPQID